MSELQQAWSSVLTQLQMDMPRASFETWVLGTQALYCLFPRAMPMPVTGWSHA